MTVSDRLKETRKKNGITRLRLAEELGIPYGTLTKYESGEREPGHGYLIAFANRFGVTVDFLLGREDESQKIPPTPAEPEQGEDAVSMKVVEDFLVSLGYIEPGEDLSDADFAIINSILDILDTWFQQER